MCMWVFVGSRRKMKRTNLVDTDREIEIGDEVQDGPSLARVIDNDGLIELEYVDNGDTIRLQRNMFLYDETEGWVTV